MMATIQYQTKVRRGIKLIAAVNGIAAILHLIFWILIFFLLPQPSALNVSAEKVDLMVTYGLGAADLLWAVPTLAIGSFWLRRQMLMGWLAAQMANILYCYSFTFILVRDLGAQSIRPGTLLFLPFALFSLWAAWYLWQVRAAFWNPRPMQSNKRLR
ncbi:MULTISPECIES: hypothetical protein [unclassified Leptolyngbya]|uniref:hypothetical protein n=1 Tax=unclassified Leptolyngbya TaxID=2650499 RepID=UPI0016835DEC|nr:MULTISPECIES: hypothetical protein [unclassified Leptolyngbya]MBD1912567.1 hypothetical protein [Leptolyngbya sp. FACHB-8]MBD2158477.1 hypothetical protein [Leptolyngbya sp. FACHB-16]